VHIIIKVLNCFTCLLTLKDNLVNNLETTYYIYLKMTLASKQIEQLVLMIQSQVITL